MRSYKRILIKKSKNPAVRRVNVINQSINQTRSVDEYCTIDVNRCQNRRATSSVPDVTTGPLQKVSMHKKKTTDYNIVWGTIIIQPVVLYCCWRQSRFSLQRAESMQQVELWYDIIPHTQFSGCCYIGCCISRALYRMHPVHHGERPPCSASA